jgi:protein TonB
VPCTDTDRCAADAAGAAATADLAGAPSPPPAAGRRARAVIVAVAGAAALLGLAGCGTAPPSARGPAAAPPRPAPAIAASWEVYRLQAAQRIVAANPDGVYAGPVPDPLLAIPVLEIVLEGDGRIRAIRVLRVPTQARDTTQLAIDAVRRAAPFGPVAHLPPPWKFAEVFLFDDTRRFKPRSLDID